MPPVRRRADEPAESVLAERQEPPPEPAVLALQRSAGNAAVAQLLAREPWVVSPGAPSVRDPLGAGDAVQHALADWTAAIDAVQVWFDKTAEPHREHGNIPGSVAELVHQASLLPYTTGDGGQGVVGDKAKPPEIEDRIRGRARTLGLRLTEHRDASDVAGVRSELGAIMANLGAIPTQVSYGDDDAKITASLTGKVTGEAKLGKVKVEGELSPDGAEGSMTLPGGGRITGHGGPEGGGAKVKVPGAEFGLEVGGKGIKAQVKAGELITIDTSITREAENVMGWKAEVSIGTIGKLLMPEDVAKVFSKTQSTFSKSAGELIDNLDDPNKVKQHGGELKEAVTEVLEKAKKSAEQAKKPGWRVGAEVKGDSAGGFNAGVTFTWVF